MYEEGQRSRDTYKSMFNDECKTASDQSIGSLLRLSGDVPRDTLMGFHCSLK